MRKSAIMFVLQHGDMAKVPCHRSSLILDGPSILAERQFLIFERSAHRASRKNLEFHLDLVRPA